MQLKVSNLPVLSNHTFFRYFTFTILYLAQGIPEGITYFAIPAWMAMNGKSPGEIGAFVGVLGIPWSFKFLIAPLMDRYTYLPMGRRRLWVLFGQLGLVVSFLLLGLVPDPLNNLNLLMLAGFMVSFFGAFQDVATDGMAIDIVPVHEQARANGLMWGAKIMGISGSLFLGTWLINHYGLREATIALAMLVALIMLVPILMRERPGEKILPWSRGKASAEASNYNWTVGQKYLQASSKFFCCLPVYVWALRFFYSTCVFHFWKRYCLFLLFSKWGGQMRLTLTCFLPLL